MIRFSKQILSAGAGLMVLWAAPAAAVEGHDVVHELETPYLTPRVTLQGQKTLQASPAWATFQQRAGVWDVTFDENTGTVFQASGLGLPLLNPTVADPAHFESAARDFIASHGPLFGVAPATLQAFHNRSFDDGHTFVLFQQMHDGLPVKNAVIQLHFVDGALIRFKSTARPVAEVPAPVLTAQQATDIAWSQLSGVKPVEVYEQPTRVVFPQETAQGFAFRPAWQLQVQTASPIARFETVVDAVDGSVLFRRNKIYNASVQLRGEVERRVVGDPIIQVGFPLTGSGGVVTNEDGMTETSAGSFNAVFTGDAFVLNDTQNAEATKNFTLLTGNDLQVLTWTAGGVGAGGDAPIEQLDAWYYSNRIHAEHMFVTPTLSLLGAQLPVNININDTCNAFFDGGSINFFRAGGGCNNTARIFDVVAHEWGHGLHFYHSPQQINAPEIQEGVADFVAAGVTGDSAIGPNFLTNGSPVRNIEPNRRYPQDFTGQVHNDGLVWGGAWWDLRKAMILKYGTARGAYLTSKLHSDTVRSAPEVTTGYADALAANDDDGNVSNGTPDSCEINEAFDLHGMITTTRQPEEGYVRFTHTPIGVVQEAGDIEIRTSATGEGCGAIVDSTSMVLKYSTDGGATFADVALTTDAGEFTGTLKGVPAGTHVKYYFEGSVSGSTRTWTWPRSAPTTFFGFFAGGLGGVQTWDFEDGGTGWTSSSTGTAITDDWEIGEPAGNAWDPQQAYQGNNIAGNDIGVRGGDGFYPNAISNRLTSPVLDCTDCGSTRLQFLRWANTAPSDAIRVLVNDVVVWEDVAGDIHDDVWVFQDIDISAVADGNKSIQIHFELASNFSGSWGGWNIDNVAVVEQSASGGPGGVAPGNALNGGCECALTTGNNKTAPAAGAVLLALIGALVVVRRRKI